MSSFEPRWRKLVLVPFWILQIFFLLVELAGTGLILAATAGVIRSYNDHTWDKDVTAVRIIFIVDAVIALGTLSLTIAEIVLFARHRLQAKFYLISCSIKAVVWVGLAVAEICVDGAKHHISPMDVIIDFVLIALFLIPTIYAVMQFRRSRAHSYKAANRDIEDVRASWPYNPDFVVETPAKQESHETRPSGMNPRRLSYNHQKDLRFEEYRRSRSSSQLESPQSGLYDVLPKTYIPQVNIEAASDDGREHTLENAARPLSFTH